MIFLEIEYSEKGVMIKLIKNSFCHYLEFPIKTTSSSRMITMEEEGIVTHKINKIFDLYNYQQKQRLWCKRKEGGKKSASILNKYEDLLNFLQR